MFDEPSSSIIPMADTQVLFVTPNHIKLKEVFETLLSNNLRPVHVERLSEVPIQNDTFRHVFVDLSVPNALKWLSELGDYQREVFPIALIQRGEREGAALAAGASLTLQLPIEPADVLLCIERNRAQIDHARNLQELMDRDRRKIATSSVEGVLTTVCQELRNPLAAALANVEYLRDIGNRSLKNVGAEEKHTIVEDTLGALKRVHSTLESLTTLVKRELLEARRIVFWEIIQSVIDGLGRDAATITLTGDPTVRGWADEQLLRQVVSTLLRRAVSSAEVSTKVPAVKIRVYATETEARVSVRDNGTSMSVDVLRDLFDASSTPSGTGRSELLLAITHHAVVRMGGVLDYAQLHSPGSVFRIRLRLVRSGE